MLGRFSDGHVASVVQRFLSGQFVMDNCYINHVKDIIEATYANPLV